MIRRSWKAYPRCQCIKLLVIGLCVTVWLGVGPVRAQTVHLPLGHWAYDLMDRFDTRGLFKLVGYDSKPLTRREVTDIIRQVNANRSRLTDLERDLLDELTGEFVDELGETNVPEREVESHLVTIGNPLNRLYLDGRVRHRTELIAGPVDQARNETILSLRGRSRFDGVVAFSGDLQYRNVSGVGPVDITVDRPRGLLYSIDDRNRHHSLIRGSMVFRFRWFRFFFGKGNMHWGPALRTSTIVSNQVPPFPMYKFIANLWGLKYTYFHGFMVNDGLDHIPGHPLDIPQRKYWAGHRLDFQFGDNVRFAAQETIVYGERGLEPLYILPVTTYYVADQNLAGDDKRNIAFDALYRARPNLKLYTQLHISDWWITEFARAIKPFKDRSARWIALAGLRAVDPYGLDNTDLRIEYTRMEPYVYTQRRPRNVYQYQLRHLGTYLQPNSDNIFIELRHRPRRDWLLSVHSQMTRHSNTWIDNIGDGDIYGVEDLARDKDFLGGEMERTMSTGLHARLEFRRRQFIEMRYSATRIRPVDFINQVPGAIFWDHRVLFQVSLDY
jgi:hypothetical protein